MVFYTISDIDMGYYCGHRRRWYNWFVKRPEFTWSTMPNHGKAMVFAERADAIAYATENLRGFHTRVAQNIFPD